MKACFKVILDKDPSKKDTIYQNAPCENFYQALLEEAQYTRAPNQVRKDSFCKQVIEWHPQKWPFTGYPYWKDCIEAADEKPRFDNLASRDQVRKLTSCLEGYTHYQKKHADPVQYDSCSATFHAFEQAWRNGIIERSKSLPVYRLNCVHYGHAVRQFVFPNPSWTFCTGYPSSDPDAQDRHFYNCMRSSLPKLSGCSDALSLYKDKLRTANMGVLPDGYAPPSCRRVEGYITAAQQPQTSESTDEEKPPVASTGDQPPTDKAENKPDADQSEKATLGDLDKVSSDNKSDTSHVSLVSIIFNNFRWPLAILITFFLIYMYLKFASMVFHNRRYIDFQYSDEYGGAPFYQRNRWIISLLAGTAFFAALIYLGLFLSNWTAPAHSFLLLGQVSPDVQIPDQSSVPWGKILFYVVVAWGIALLTYKDFWMSFFIIPAAFIFQGLYNVSDFHKIFYLTNLDVYSEMSVGTLVSYVFTNASDQLAALTGLWPEFNPISDQLETKYVRLVNLAFSWVAFGPFVSWITIRIFFKNWRAVKTSYYL